MNPIELKSALERPFKTSQLNWRVGATNKKKVQPPDKGIALAYLDARNVMQRLDEAVGFQNWQNRYTLSEGGLLVCEIGIRFDNEWLWRSNGAGETDIEGEKGKASDAFKRAGVMWGIGRYLYQLPNVWVPIDKFGKVSKLPDLPPWATPEGYDQLMKKRAEQEAA